MSDTILLLRLEHGNMARLLDWVEDQIRILESGSTADNNLLNQALYYLQNYPDQCHHPKEDLVLETMARRSPEAAAEIGDLAGEHNRIADLTVQAVMALNRAEGNDLHLQEALRELSTEYRRHMQKEETMFFPRALEVLDRSDWASIDFDLFDRDDPLFDHSQEQRFRELREGISRYVGNRPEITSARQEYELLENLNGISEFNLAMDKLGSKLRLVRFSEGGYGLERQGKLLAYIPSFEEILVIRYAYYYAKGAEDINLA